MCNNLIKKFSNERNLKDGTIKGYESSIKKYTQFHKKDMSYLLNEAYLDENSGVLLKERRIKKRLLDFRYHLLNSNLSPNTAKSYLVRIKTFYLHFEVELPSLPPVKYNKLYEVSYLDLPNKEDISKVLEIVSIDFKAIILFMSSSGTAKAETLSLTVNDFIKGVSEYYDSYNLEKILDTLNKRKDIVPTLYLKRIKTNKFYYTFCSPEASTAIIKYLKTRKNLSWNDKLFPFSSSYLITKFQEINDKLNFGQVGYYRFFRTHSLRKYHSSNLGIATEYIDALQGRSKNKVHEAYIKTNPKKLKEIYKNAMHNVMIYHDNKNRNDIIKNEEINININIFIADTHLNI